MSSSLMWFISSKSISSAPPFLLNSLVSFVGNHTCVLSYSLAVGNKFIWYWYDIDAALLNMTLRSIRVPTLFFRIRRIWCCLTHWYRAFLLGGYLTVPQLKTEVSLVFFNPFDSCYLFRFIYNFSKMNLGSMELLIIASMKWDMSRELSQG